MTTLRDWGELAGREQGLVVVSTVRADRTVHASLVNAGVLVHPDDGRPIIGFVTYGKVKLRNVRAHPQLAMTVRSDRVGRGRPPRVTLN